MKRKLSRKKKNSQIEKLRAELMEARETLRAIQSGEVDGLVVSDTTGSRVYTLQGADNSYRMVVEQMTEGAVSVSPEGTILYCNQSFARQVRQPLEQVIGGSIYNYVSSAGQGQLRMFLESAERRLQREFTMVRADETSFPCYFSANVLSSSQVPAFCIVTTDLSEQKKNQEYIVSEKVMKEVNAMLEKNVSERTAELAASNKELESFCYSVAHDLRSPLRTITGFSEILMEDAAGRLTPETTDYMRRIQKASRHMSQLIDDLLSFSRLGRCNLNKTAVDLSGISKNVADEVFDLKESRNVTFKIQPGLKTVGDPVLLRVVIQNLFDNAWKFTAKKLEATIEFGEMDKDGQRVFFVRDNGAGFSMAHADKLFQVFQRLHGKEFPGTGIGLATVQRILQRHGGNIWGVGRVDGGARFYFTVGKPFVPAKPEEKATHRSASPVHA